MARGPVPDKPVNRPTVAELQPLIDAYYQFEECGVGGDLHVVLDDGNWEDGNIQWCIDHAGEYGSREPECAKLLGRLLLLTTRTQRGRLNAGYGGHAMTRAEFIERATVLLKRCEPATSADAVDPVATSQAPTSTREEKSSNSRASTGSDGRQE